MLFSSMVFLFVFLPCFLGLYFLVKNVKYRNFILLVFSLLFYAWGEPIYIFLMILSIVVNYLFAKAIDVYKSKAKKILILSLIFNIGLLLVFKYTDFFINTFNTIFSLNVNLLNIALPIGISFYTFQILSYVIDVYRGDVKVQNSIMNLACYVSAFPQLIAGPIVRYSTINEELHKRRVTLNDFAEGIRRFILGLGKKVIIANQMAYVADHIFALSATEYGIVGCLIGIITYSLQIYFDFSGYSDMAIGLGRMLGFHYLENFNYPYIARSITEFWRRWHISLSSFFKDYVYIPLGGNRVKKILHIRNILIVWMLTGLWHGASWNFVLWGLYYGIILLVEKYLNLKKIPSFFQHLYTIILITIGWLIFRGVEFSDLINSFSALFGKYGLGNWESSILKVEIFQVRYIVAFVLGVIFATPIYPKLKARIEKQEGKKLILDAIILLIFVLSIIFLVVDSYNPFIYFRF